MQGNVWVTNVKDLEITRVTTGQIVYTIEFKDSDSSVFVQLTQESLNVLYKLTLDYQEGMPGYSGMRD